MTTQLDIDDAVLDAAKQIAATSGRSVGAVVSELARRGLNAEPAENASRLRIEVRDGFAVGYFDPAPAPINLSAVRDALEDPDA